MQVAPKVRLVAVPDEHIMRLGSINVYLIGEKETILVDSGLGEEKSNEMILASLKDLSAKLSYIVITHCHQDHFGGAKALREATGAKVAVHSKNAALLEEEADGLKADVLLEHGDVLEVDGLKIEVVHTPGHSPGDICLFWRECGILFTGDTIVGVGTVVVDGDMVQYMDSLERLLDYDATMICPGHGPMVQDAKAKIKAVIDHRNMREEQIIAQLTQGNKTPHELMLAIYYDVDKRLHEPAERNVNGHLLKLMQEGRVSKIETESEEESQPVYELLR